MNTTKPRPTCPSTFSAGTRKLSNEIAAVGEPCRPILCSYLPGVKPSVGLPSPSRVSITNAVAPPRAPNAGSVTANMLIVLAMGPLVIHIFDPSRMYESPSFVARSLIDAASDPACGSVSAKAAIFLPLHRSGRYFSRMCLLPPR